MDRITIIGLGLIGGSLGMALKAAKLKNVEVVGVDNSWDTVNAAKRRGAVDIVERDIGKAVRDAQMVVVATPILAFPQVFEAISPYLKEGVVVTDVGSTKSQVMQWAQELLPPEVNFVGGHPMAGKETAGIESADATLFQGTTYCVLPSSTATKSAVELVSGLATTVGAEPYFIDIEEHDMLVGGISHLPLILAAALVSATSTSPSWDEMAKLASSGFRDTSRLASSDFELVKGISSTNQAGLLHWIDAYLTVLLDFKKALVEDPERFLVSVEKAREARDRWLSGAYKRLGPQTEIPTAGEQMAELFMGSRLANAMKDQGERLKELEKGPRKEG